MQNTIVFLTAAMILALGGCLAPGNEMPIPLDDGSAEVMTTDDGVQFVRTPDERFAGLPDWPYEPKYVEIDGLRQAYVDEGPADGEVVLLLHGQPSWSYLYRKMIPVLADAGMRVIAMDHLGMGRSDKPIDIASYSYLGHNDRLLRFIEQLDLHAPKTFITGFARDARHFSQISWTEGADGIPSLPGVLARFDCRLHAAHPAGDHVVLGTVALDSGDTVQLWLAAPFPAFVLPTSLAIRSGLVFTLYSWERDDSVQ